MKLQIAYLTKINTDFSDKMVDSPNLTIHYYRSTPMRINGFRP